MSFFDFRQRMEYVGCVVGGRVVRLLPFRWLGGIARPLGTLAFLFDRRGRETSLENLRAVFGDTKSDREKWRIAKGGYQSFARTMIELFWSPNLTPEAVNKFWFSTGILAADAGCPSMYVTTHFSNFELLSLDIAYQRGPGILVTQKFTNPLLEKYFAKLRASTGHQIIPQERALARMFRHLKKGGYFNAAIDLNLDPKESSVIIDEFSGMKTCVTQIHAALALHTGARIVPCECLPRPDGRYDLRYHPPLEYPSDATPAEIAQMCWDVLEPGILNHPEGWLWSYKHWRYKPSLGDTSRYPAYANRAKRFDAALSAGRTGRTESVVRYRGSYAFHRSHGTP